MRKWLAGLMGAIVAGVIALAQPRVSNWAGLGGDPQHSGWERADSRFTPETAKDIQLLWKMKLDQPPLTAPVILGNLISYRGFKELAFVASGSDVLYAIDADLGKLFWTKHLEYVSLEPKPSGGSGACPGGLTATPVMPVPAPRGAPPAARGPAVAPAAAGANNAAGRGRGATGGGRGRGGAATPAPAPAPPPPPRGPFAAVGTSSVYVLSSDGRLHRINTSTGDDFTQPIGVIAANANASSLNLNGNILYAVTSHACDDSPDAVWAVDLAAEILRPISFMLTDGSSGAGNPVLGTDGTVYVQTGREVLALDGKDLQLKHSFSLNGSEPLTPLVFNQDGHDWIAASGKEGSLYLLDSATLQLVSQSAPASGGLSGALASWQDGGGTRWLLAPERGAIAAFKVEDRDGKPALTRAWTSGEIASPQTPVIAGGMIFALASAGPRAVLYALDAATGRELYSSADQVPAPASPSGMTAANGRVYFATADGTVYCFGIFLER